jgi:hypothetical protein
LEYDAEVEEERKKKKEGEIWTAKSFIKARGLSQANKEVDENCS